MQGASVKQTRSVCSERARTPAGGRSRCVFAKQIRGFSAQSPSPKQMCCRRHFCQLCPRTNGSPHPRRIELYAGRERKENASVTQGGTRFPNGSPGGKRVPESALRLGRSFRMAPQTETTTRNRAVEWDMLSQWQLKRKVHPGILIRNGMQFPGGNSCSGGWPGCPDPLTPKPMRPPFQNWVEESQNAIAGGQYDCRR